MNIHNPEALADLQQELPNTTLALLDDMQSLAPEFALTELIQYLIWLNEEALQIAEKVLASQVASLEIAHQKYSMNVCDAVEEAAKLYNFS